MTNPAIRRWDRQTALVAGLAAGVSVISFLIYFHRGDILLYGDAVAHINIARRVFDSRTPGLLQLGTVWLPLPHLLMIPFLLSDWMWRTGVGGSIPSMAAYVLSTVGIFRLVREALISASAPDRKAGIAAWGAALVYAANPNLIYLQTTAMTELVYLAFFIWAVVYLGEFVREADAEKIASSSLLKCGLCLVGACLTRYDGWFLAAAVGAAALMLCFRRKHLRTRVLRFVLLVSAAPVFWLAYNAVIYRNPLEFATGPYSAKAIERKISVPGVPHPGTNDLPAAALYFFKSAQLNMAHGDWQAAWVLWFWLAAVGLLAVWRAGILWLLGVPVPFYMLSVAYGGVPIYVTPWWPFSLYNVRYGLELLPAFAAAFGIVLFLALKASRILRWVTVLGSLVLLVASYTSVWRAQPISFREAWINSRTRIALESALAARLKALPPDATVLIYLGDHPGALQQAGIPLRRVIHEGNHRPWKQPSDPEGLWERALAEPAQYADFVVVMDGDAVALGVNRRDLSPMAEINVPGQPQARIYAARSSAR